MKKQNANAGEIENMESDSNQENSAEKRLTPEMETLPVPVDEFVLTRLLRTINGKLKDGIAGVMQQAYRFFKTFLVFVKDTIVHLVVDGIPWLLRLTWRVLRFVFGRKMINLIKENVLLIILLPIFIASLAWPLVVYVHVEKAYWLWIGWAWLVCIGLVGAWAGFKNGLYSKWLKIWRTRRANNKARTGEALHEVSDESKNET